MSQYQNRATCPELSFLFVTERCQVKSVRNSKLLMKVGSQSEADLGRLQLVSGEGTENSIKFARICVPFIKKAASTWCQDFARSSRKFPFITQDAPFTRHQYVI